MEFGWIDFSKNERNKVLSVLELLSEAGTLDELGIAPIRDGFANMFFPGTSTIQTRAKYFLIVPYGLKDMEQDKDNNPNTTLKKFDELEKNCAKKLLENNKDELGVIGSVSLANNSWVKRTPADIYWAGLRTYGIFTNSKLSLSEYVRFYCQRKKEKQTIKTAGKYDTDEDNDDEVGSYLYKPFWNIPTYTNDWFNSLDIHLTNAEGQFLKNQIISQCSDSMLAYMLKNNLVDHSKLGSFQNLETVIDQYPQDIQKKYKLAKDFSRFIYVLRVIYNIIITEGKNTTAVKELEETKEKWQEIASVDLESIFSVLMIQGNTGLTGFLRNAKNHMLNNDYEGLVKDITDREVLLKGIKRARTKHPGESNPSVWYGGRELDYRYSNAMVIAQDIFESEGEAC